MSPSSGPTLPHHHHLRIRPPSPALKAARLTATRVPVSNCKSKVAALTLSPAVILTGSTFSNRAGGPPTHTARGQTHSVSRTSKAFLSKYQKCPWARPGSSRGHPAPLWSGPGLTVQAGRPHCHLPPDPSPGQQAEPTHTVLLPLTWPPLPGAHPESPLLFPPTPNLASIESLLNFVSCIVVRTFNMNKF